MTTEERHERYPAADEYDLIRYHDYRRLELFLDAVAERCLEKMPEESQQALMQNPEPSRYHETLGLYIRNEYLYPQKYYMTRDIQWAQEHGEDWSLFLVDSAFTEELFGNADHYSQNVIKRIMKLLGIDDSIFIDDSLFSDTW